MSEPQLGLGGYRPSEAGGGETLPAQVEKKTSTTASGKTILSVEKASKESSVVKERLGALEKKQEALGQKLYQKSVGHKAISPESLMTELKAHKDEITYLKGRLADLRVQLPQLKEADDKLKLQNQVHQLELKLTKADKAVAHLSQLGEDDKFVAILKARQEAIQACIMHMGSNASAEKKAIYITSFVDRIRNIVSDSKRLPDGSEAKTEAQKMLAETLTFLAGALTLCKDNIGNEFKYGAFLGRLGIGKKNINEMHAAQQNVSNTIDTIQQLKKQVAVPGATTAGSVAVLPSVVQQSTLQQVAVGQGPASAGAQAKVVASTATPSLTQEARKIEKISKDVLAVESKIELQIKLTDKAMAEIATGDVAVMGQNMQEHIGHIEGYINELSNQLSALKDEAARATSRTGESRAKVFGKIDYLEHRIQEMSTQLSGLRQMNVAQYHDLVSCEQQVKWHLEKSPKVAMSVYDAIKELRQFESKWPQNTLDTLPDDVKTLIKSRLDTLRDTVAVYAKTRLELDDKEAHLLKHIHDVSPADLEKMAHRVQSILAKLMIQGLYSGQNTDLDRLLAIIAYKTENNTIPALSKSIRDILGPLQTEYETKTGFNDRKDFLKALAEFHECIEVFKARKDDRPYLFQRALDCFGQMQALDPNLASSHPQEAQEVQALRAGIEKSLGFTSDHDRSRGNLSDEEKLRNKLVEGKVPPEDKDGKTAQRIATVLGYEMVRALYLADPQKKGEAFNNAQKILDALDQNQKPIDFMKGVPGGEQILALFEAQKATYLSGQQRIATKLDEAERLMSDITQGKESNVDSYLQVARSWWEAGDALNILYGQQLAPSTKAYVENLEARLGSIAARLEEAAKSDSFLKLTKDQSRVLSELGHNVADHGWLSKNSDTLVSLLANRLVHAFNCIPRGDLSESEVVGLLSELTRGDAAVRQQILASLHEKFPELLPRFIEEAVLKKMTWQTSEGSRMDFVGQRETTANGSMGFGQHQVVALIDRAKQLAPDWCKAYINAETIGLGPYQEKVLKDSEALKRFEAATTEFDQLMSTISTPSSTRTSLILGTRRKSVSGGDLTPVLKLVQAKEKLGEMQKLQGTGTERDGKIAQCEAEFKKQQETVLKLSKEEEKLLGSIITHNAGTLFLLDETNTPTLRALMGKMIAQQLFTDDEAQLRTLNQNLSRLFSIIQLEKIPQILSDDTKKLCDEYLKNRHPELKKLLSEAKQKTEDACKKTTLDEFEKAAASARQTMKEASGQIGAQSWITRFDNPSAHEASLGAAKKQLKEGVIGKLRDSIKDDIEDINKMLGKMHDPSSVEELRGKLIAKREALVEKIYKENPTLQDILFPLELGIEPLAQINAKAAEVYLNRLGNEVGNITKILQSSEAPTVQQRQSFEKGFADLSAQLPGYVVAHLMRKLILTDTNRRLSGMIEGVSDPGLKRQLQKVYVAAANPLADDPRPMEVKQKLSEVCFEQVTLLANLRDIENLIKALYPEEASKILRDIGLADALKINQEIVDSFISAFDKPQQDELRNLCGSLRGGDEQKVRAQFKEYFAKHVDTTKIAAKVNLRSITGIQEPMCKVGKFFLPLPAPSDSNKAKEALKVFCRDVIKVGYNEEKYAAMNIDELKVYVEKNVLAFMTQYATRSADGLKQTIMHETHPGSRNIFRDMHVLYAAITPALNKLA